MTSSHLQMMTLSSCASIGVSTKDGDVFMAFDTEESYIDVTMTRDQAAELGNKLLQAANSVATRQETGWNNAPTRCSEISNRKGL